MATFRGLMGLKPASLSQALPVVSRCVLGTRTTEFLVFPQRGPDVLPDSGKASHPSEEAGHRFPLVSPFCLVTVQGPDPPLLPHGRGPNWAPAPRMQTLAGASGGPPGLPPGLQPTAARAP